MKVAAALIAAVHNVEDINSRNIDSTDRIWYYNKTLCTAYITTVQTEQTVTCVMESGHLCDSGILLSTGQ